MRLLQGLYTLVLATFKVFSPERSFVCSVLSGQYDMSSGSCGECIGLQEILVTYKTGHFVSLEKDNLLLCNIYGLGS